MSVGGSQTLERFVSQVAKDVSNPETGISVWQRRKLLDISRAATADRDQVRKRSDLRLGALGDGSDYTASIHHVGIPSANISFGGEDGGGVYHSIYDDFHWYTHFGDPDFAYERAEAQLVGSAVMRMADAELLPFDFTGFADNMRRYLDDLKKQVKSAQDLAHEQKLESEEGV